MALEQEMLRAMAVDVGGVKSHAKKQGVFLCSK